MCPMPGMVSGVRGAGVEEIVGCRAVFVRGSGMGMLLGSRTATSSFLGGRCFRCPVVSGRGIGFPWLGAVGVVVV